MMSKRTTVRSAQLQGYHSVRILDHGRWLGFCYRAVRLRRSAGQETIGETQAARRRPVLQESIRAKRRDQAMQQLRRPRRRQRDGWQAQGCQNDKRPAKTADRSKEPKCV